MKLTTGTKARAVVAVLLIAAGLEASSAFAQGYPDRPIRFIAAFPAGGGVDAVARIVGEPLSARLGQPVVVENKTGAAGMIGSATVASAPGDGYTVLVTSNPSITIAAAGQKRSYEPLEDLLALVKATTAPSIVVTAAANPMKSMADMIARAKAEPGTISFATAGAGSTQHVEMEVIKERLGLDVVHVPYRGTALLLPDVLSGQVAIGVPAMPAAASNVKGRQLTGLAVLAEKRSEAAPEVPTLREAAGLDFGGIPSWFGFFLPASTPRELAERLEQHITEILRAPEVRNKLITLGMDVVAEGSVAFEAANRAEAALISDIFHRKAIHLQ